MDTKIINKNFMNEEYEINKIKNRLKEKKDYIAVFMEANNIIKEYIGDNYYFEDTIDEKDFVFLGYELTIISGDEKELDEIKKKFIADDWDILNHFILRQNKPNFYIGKFEYTNNLCILDYNGQYKKFNKVEIPIEAPNIKKIISIDKYVEIMTHKVIDIILAKIRRKNEILHDYKKIF